MGEKIEISNKIDKNEWVQEQLKKTFSKEIGDLGNDVRKSLETNLNNDKVIKTLEEGKRRLEKNGNKLSNIFGNGSESKGSNEWKGEYRGAGFTLALQIALNKIEGINISADGVYGPELKAALKNFQKDNGLNSDGIAGAKTLETIISKLKKASQDKGGQQNKINKYIYDQNNMASKTDAIKSNTINNYIINKARGEFKNLKEDVILREKIKASKVIVDKIKSQYNIEPKGINRIAKNDKIKGIDVVILQSTNLRDNIELVFTKTNKQAKYPFAGGNYADRFTDNTTFMAWPKLRNGGDFYNLKIKESPDKNNPLFKGLISLEAKKVMPKNRPANNTITSNKENGNKINLDNIVIADDVSEEVKKAFNINKENIKKAKDGEYIGDEKGPGFKKFGDKVYYNSQGKLDNTRGRIDDKVTYIILDKPYAIEEKNEIKFGFVNLAKVKKDNKWILIDNHGFECKKNDEGYYKIQTGFSYPQSKFVYLKLDDKGNISNQKEEVINESDKLGSEIVSQIEDMLIPSVEKKLNNISGLKNFMINYINGLNPEKQKTLLNAVEEGELDEDTKKIILDNFDLMNDGQKKKAKDILDKNSDFIKSVSKELDGTEEGKFLLKLLGKLGWKEKPVNTGVTVEVIEKPKDDIKNENLKKLEDAKDDLEMIDMTILGKDYKIGNMKYINKLESDIRKSYEMIDKKEYNINKGYSEKDKKQIQEYIDLNKDYLSNQKKLIPYIKPDSLISKTYEAIKSDLKTPKNDFQSKQKLSIDVIKYNQAFDIQKSKLLSMNPSITEFEKNLKLFEQGSAIKIRFGNKTRDIEKAKG